MDKISLNKDQKLLVDSFYKVRIKKDLAKFIEDLFSPEETLDLAQRLKIAKLILDGYLDQVLEPEVLCLESTNFHHFGQFSLWYYMESGSFPKSRAQKMSGGAAGGPARLWRGRRDEARTAKPDERGVNTIRF